MTGIGHITFLAVIEVLCVLFTLRRIMPWRTIFGYAVVIDVTFTVVMIGLFKGTVSGAASATLAGLFLAVALTVGRLLIGGQQYRISRGRVVLRRTHTGKFNIASPFGAVRLWAQRGKDAAQSQISAAKQRMQT